MRMFRIRDLQIRVALYDDEQAFSELYLLLSEELYQCAYKIIKSRENSEEIVSDVFIKLWKVRSNIMHINNLKLYLYKTTKNYCLNLLAKKSLSTASLSSCCEIESPSNPEEICISKESIIRIKRAVQHLPIKCRNIFLLVKGEGLPYKDVSSLLNISTFTVRNQMIIATKKINRSLMVESKEGSI